MTSQRRIMMLWFLTVLIFLCQMTFWKLHWGSGLGFAEPLEWLFGALYGAGSTALMWSCVQTRC